MAEGAVTISAADPLTSVCAPGLPGCPGRLLRIPEPTHDLPRPRETALPVASSCQEKKLPGTPAPETGNCSFPVL